jgi:hypothetical protein
MTSGIKLSLGFFSFNLTCLSLEVKHPERFMILAFPQHQSVGQELWRPWGPLVDSWNPTTVCAKKKSSLILKKVLTATTK